MQNARRKKEHSILCPACNSEVDSNRAICPACDHILDDSFLRQEGSPPEGEVAEPTRISPPPFRTRRTTANSAQPTAPKAARRRRAHGANASSAERPDAPGPSPSPLPSTSVKGASDGLADHNYAEAFWDTLRQLVLPLSNSERLTASFAFLTVLDAFLPWRETRLEGEVMGWLSLGLPAVLAAVCILGCIGMRHFHSGALRPGALWAAQLSASAFGPMWALVFIRMSYQPGRLPALAGNIDVPVSMPSAGAYLGLFFLVASFLGTLWSLKQRDALSQ